MTTRDALKLFMNKGTYAGVLLAIVALAFAAIVYIYDKGSADFVMSVLGVIVVPLCTSLVLGPPLKTIAHNTNGALKSKLDTQTEEIVNQLITPPKDGDEDGKQVS